MSATVCKPVMSNLSSLGPKVMFTLQDSPFHSISIQSTYQDCQSSRRITNASFADLHMVEEECAAVSPLK